jgi:hypothetical protein
MKSKVYIETSVFSYLAARMSRDMVVAGHQQISQERWEVRNHWELYASCLAGAEAKRI